MIRVISLDLSEVKLVDRDVIGFLATCEANGVKLRELPGVYPGMD